MVPRMSFVARLRSGHCVYRARAGDSASRATDGQRASAQRVAQDRSTPSVCAVGRAASTLHPALDIDEQVLPLRRARGAIVATIMRMRMFRRAAGGPRRALRAATTRLEYCGCGGGIHLGPFRA